MTPTPPVPTDPPLDARGAEREWHDARSNLVGWAVAWARAAAPEYSAAQLLGAVAAYERACAAYDAARLTTPPLPAPAGLGVAPQPESPEAGGGGCYVEGCAELGEHRCEECRARCCWQHAIGTHKDVAHPICHRCADHCEHGVPPERDCRECDVASLGEEWR